MIRRLEVSLIRFPNLANAAGRQAWQSAPAANVKQQQQQMYRFLLGGGGGIVGASAAVYCSLLSSHSAALSGESDETDDINEKKAYRPVLRSGNGKGGGAGKPDEVDQLIDAIMPVLQRLGFGGVMGICAGVAMKRLGNEVAAVVGTGFVILQGLAYMGYISIDYSKVQDDAKKLVDQDGDGKLTASDLKILWHKIKDVLVFHLPGMGGFSAGVALGLRYGA